VHVHLLITCVIRAQIRRAHALPCESRRWLSHEERNADESHAHAQRYGPTLASLDAYRGSVRCSNIIIAHRCSISKHRGLKPTWASMATASAITGATSTLVLVTGAAPERAHPVCHGSLPDVVAAIYFSCTPSSAVLDFG
jgi:hypothetical protein